jgi:hypothetical protein
VRTLDETPVQDGRSSLWEHPLSVACFPFDVDEPPDQGLSFENQAERGAEIVERDFPGHVLL